MKIIFLDIDGVVCHLRLRCAEALKGNIAPYDALDTNILTMLKHIQEKTGCLFVLSSRAWRLKFKSKENVEKVTGLVFHDDWKTKEPSDIASLYRQSEKYVKDKRIPPIAECKDFRGWEVQDWLNRHNNEVSDYFMIDDDDDYFPIPDKNFIHVVNGEENGGLSVKQYDRILNEWNETNRTRNNYLFAVYPNGKKNPPYFYHSKKMKTDVSIRLAAPKL